MRVCATALTSHLRSFSRSLPVSSLRCSEVPLSGGTVTLEVSLLGLTVTQKRIPLCQLLRCPVPVGPFTGVLDLPGGDIPPFAPPGTYIATARVVRTNTTQHTAHSSYPCVCPSLTLCRVLWCAALWCAVLWCSSMSSLALCRALRRRFSSRKGLCPLRERWNGLSAGGAALLIC
jgi:hypothetical protein